MAHSTVKKSFWFYFLVCLLLVSESESATLKVVSNSNISDVSEFLPVREFDGIIIGEKSNGTNTSIAIEEIFKAIRKLSETDTQFHSEVQSKELPRSNEDPLPEPSRVENRRNTITEPDFAIPFFKSYDRLSTFILNILFGMVFDWKNVNSIVKEPISLFIGVFSKCLLVPLVSIIIEKKNIWFLNNNRKHNI